MDYYVYMYYDGETPIYVGKGKGQRYKVHLKKFLKTDKGKIPFYDKLHKMKNEGKTPIVKIIEYNLSETEALIKEKEHSDKIGTIFKNTGPLFNYNECGVKNPILRGEKNHMYGKSLFKIWVDKYGHKIAREKIKDYNEKMSQSLKGKKHNSITKNKIKKQKQEYWDGITDNEKNKFKKKISESHTEERKKNAKERMILQNKKMTGKNHPKSKKCFIEGKEYNSISEVCKVYNFKNHNTVRNRINSNNFPQWRYVN